MVAIAVTLIISESYLKIIVNSIIIIVVAVVITAAIVVAIGIIIAKFNFVANII